MEKLSILLNRNSRFILYTTISLILLPFFALSFFNHPASDDFCYTNLLQEDRFWSAQIKHYLFWTGRFTATLLLTVDPIDLNNLTTYKILPVGLFLSFGISIFLFVRSLIPNLSQKHLIVLSSLILFLYLYYTPSIAEAFYWRAGSVTYQLASVLSLLLFATIRHLQQQQSFSKRIILTILACLLAASAIGLNETSMIIILVIVSMWTIGWFYKRKEKRVEMALILLITIVATTTVIIAPGNAVRMAEKPEKFQFLFSLVGAIKITLVNILRWIPMPVLLLALFSPLFSKVANVIRTRYNLNCMKAWHVLLCGFFLFAFIVLCFFPSFWSQGGPPPFRTVNVIYLLFILGMFFLSLLFYVYLQNNNSPVPQLPRGIKLVLTIITLTIVTTKPNNIRVAYLDIFEGTAYRYSLEMEERYRLLENCSGKACTVPSLQNKPRTILSSDLSSDPSHENYYYNECVAYYLGISQILIPENNIPTTNKTVLD